MSDLHLTREEQLAKLANAKTPHERDMIIAKGLQELEDSFKNQEPPVPAPLAVAGIDSSVLRYQLKCLVREFDMWQGKYDNVIWCNKISKLRAELFGAVQD